MSVAPVLWMTTLFPQSADEVFFLLPFLSHGGVSPTKGQQ
ncbi:hypothetical protein HMPREF0183_2320 [Brevibacterium mcbrellneri ATCC 49030]|uniref:Uncharacterized protein n=1 Tax=Brevibacterium mcbrellneri ATCC 49030 TaxID=585530 RepID=D4YQW0_9MICO|nr:hypothetical protein HMPREF0183_2320 [Brevibacterium mcbrellneri ATCC 49030]